MSDLKIEIWPVDRIRPFPDNVRLHDERQMHFITQSILQFGFVNPILVDADGECIAGHGRLKAMKMLERTEVPVIVLGHLTPAQARAYRIADNQIPLSATWNEELYRQQLAEFMSAGFPMDALGWDPKLLDEFIQVGNPGLTDPDEVPESPKEPFVMEGDNWLLGDHVLLCWDSTDEAIVECILGEQEYNLMVTDPPYGVDYDPRWRLETGINKPHQKRAEGRVQNDDRADWRAAWKAFKGDVAYVWHGGLHAAEVAESLTDAGFQIRSQIIWAKPSLVIGRGNYHWQHEPCWYAVRKKGHWRGGRQQSTVWNIQNMHRTQGNVDDGKTIHSAQKPVECMKRPMENNSRPGDHVYDPFVGSGTTIIAAEMTGRRCFGVELNPIYAQVTIERWQNFTGREAKLDDDRTFSEVKQERADAKSNSGVTVHGKNVARSLAKPKVRKKVHARQPAAR